jgi:hypothetical protein
MPPDFDHHRTGRAHPGRARGGDIAPSSGVRPQPWSFRGLRLARRTLTTGVSSTPSLVRTPSRLPGGIGARGALNETGPLPAGPRTCGRFGDMRARRLRADAHRGVGRTGQAAARGPEVGWSALSGRHAAAPSRGRRAAGGGAAGGGGAAREHIQRGRGSASVRREGAAQTGSDRTRWRLPGAPAAFAGLDVLGAGAARAARSSGGKPQRCWRVRAASGWAGIARPAALLVIGKTWTEQARYRVDRMFERARCRQACSNRVAARSWAISRIAPPSARRGRAVRYLRERLGALRVCRSRAGLRVGHGDLERAARIRVAWRRTMPRRARSSVRLSAPRTHVLCCLRRARRRHESRRHRLERR